MEYIIIGAAIWIACGIGGAGFFFAYIQDEYPEFANVCYDVDMGNAQTIVIFGPFSLVMCFLICDKGRHGWRLWRNGNKEGK